MICILNSLDTSIVQTFFDAEIKRRGVKPCYFPLFVTENVLQREKDHIEGFAPEVILQPTACFY